MKNLSHFRKSAVRGFAGLIFLHFSATAQTQTLPSDDHYVQVSKEGFLTLDGKRVRFWGTVLNYMSVRAQGEGAEGLTILKTDGIMERKRKIDERRHAIDLTADRLAKLGFNLIRSWDEFDPSKPYLLGDGSDQDMFAYACASFEKRGIKIWSPQFNNLGTIDQSDVDIIQDPVTAESWKTAIKEWNIKSTQSIRASKFYVLDPRTSALRIKRMKAWADFPNLYKGGLRFGDDPQVVVWELTNEEWWFTSMLNGAWQSYPKFFRDQMISAWHSYLSKKYGTEAALVTSWGFLLPGESLEKKNVLLAPLASPVNNLVLNDVNPLAISTQSASSQKVTRGDFTRQRGADVIEFLLQAIVERKKAERDAVKTWGKSCKLSPLIVDTGDGFRIQTIYLQQQADAVAMCTYLEGFANDTQEPRFPWYSYLDEPPRMSHDVPWSEIGRVPGKPFFIYETQMMNPSKYRAEYPYRILAQAAIQDWDIVVWHCFPRPIFPKGDRPYDRKMEVGQEGFPAEGFHFRFDEVQSAALATAAIMFRTGAFQTVKDPTFFTFGKDLLFDPVSMDYGKSFGPYSEKMSSTSFRHGLRMLVDPHLDSTTVKGELVTPRIHEGNPINSTPEIQWDWRRSHLKMDSANAAVYTGFFSQYGGPVEFETSKMKLSDIRVLNPDNAPFPISPDEKYIAFGAVARDGKPLAKSTEIELTLVSTSFNTAASLDTKNLIGAKSSRSRLTGSNPGLAPVLVSRVSGRISAAFLTGMNYRFLDWHLNEIEKGNIGPDGLLVPADQPIFQIILSR